MAIDPKTPVIFELPDGDNVQLINWDFVLYKLTELITPLNAELVKTNQALDRINSRVDHWLEQQEE